MRVKSLIYLNLILFVTICYAKSGWYNQNSGTNAILQDVFFVDQDYGWIAGAHIILHTTDGGDTWVEQPAPPVQIFYADIFFPDRMNGWACGNGAQIIHTSDGGNTWNIQPNPYEGGNNILYDLYFANKDTGWVVGGDHGIYPTFINQRVILGTTNGGSTWDYQLNVLDEWPLYCVDFISDTEGFAASEFGDVTHTSNGGNNWAEVNPVSSYRLIGIYFVSSSTGWVSGEYLGVPHVASISKTTDGGITWNTQSFGTDESLTDIYFVDDMNGWAVGGALSGSGTSTILHTIDGGENWVSQTSPTTNALYGLSFADVNHGWAVGFNGTIVHTTTGGIVGIEEKSNTQMTIPEKVTLYNNYPNPFNPVTTIQYEIPRTARVTVKIYDMLGREVKTLVNRVQSPGQKSVIWDGTDQSGNLVSSGIYLYRLQSGEFTESKKMILMK